MLRTLSLSFTLLAERLLQFKRRPYELILGGHIYFQTLSAAVQFDLFTLLDETGAMTQEEIARKLNIGAQPCRILLLGLTSLKLLKRSASGQYRNMPIAGIYLSSRSKKNLIDVIKWQHFINYRAMGHFHEALKSGTNVGLNEFAGSEPYLYGRLTHDPALEKIFQDAMQEISAQASANFARHADMKGVKFLLDVGGGNGSNIITLAREHPALKAAIFDSPTVCAIARENIANHGLSQRLSAYEGDCFKNPFPSDVDAILFCHFFTIWSLEENLELLKRAYAALPSGGRVMIFNMMQEDDRSGPLSAALGSPYFLTLATGKGMLYCWQEYKDLFAQAGFKNITTQRLPRSHGVITGFKA